MREIDPVEKTKIKAKICENLATLGGILVSIGDAGIDTSTYYVWLREDPVFATEVMKSKAHFARALIPAAIEKEPFKMLKSMYPADYAEEPTLQINIENRPLLNQPSEKLLELLEMNDSGKRQITDKK